MIFFCYRRKLNKVARACDTGPSIHEQRKIHGPANIRSEPNGQNIASLPMGYEVLALKNLPFKNAKGKESYWFFIQWQQSGKTRQGWTHENNIICD
ncbi:MAG: hypothetical protein R3257_04940 [bacterium]|nr:hypothetical protein [bacterium]